VGARWSSGTRNRSDRARSDLFESREYARAVDVKIARHVEPSK
jgi:hypothetical protein